jgi:flagella basal body P-ring formation protein FlgA
VNKALPLLLLLLACACPVAAEPPALDTALAARVQVLAEQASRLGLASGLRAEVRVGRLDPRLKLAPCADVRPHLPAGTRLWGSARIGLRCHDGAVRWNVYLPLTVDVYGPGLVAGMALPAGHVLSAGDLRSAEVLLSAAPSAALARSDAAVGRALARPLAAGDALREADLKLRQYFAAGDTVRIVAAGQGWRIAGEGQALAPGVEGRSVRVRTESGRIVAGLAVREREVEVEL